jgi:phosphopantetheinyl transferase (holo-ACP synthase)
VKEKEEYENTTDKDGYLIKAWTKKESVFKAKGGKYKLTDKEDDYDNTKSLELEFGSEKYCLSVTGEEIDKLKIITGKRL